MDRLLARIALASAAAALLAGCGGPDRAAYERDLAKVGRRVDAALASLPQDDRSTLGAEDVAGLADDLREAANQLDDLEPPKDAAAPQRKLERGLRGVADAFDDLARDLRAANTDAARAERFVEFATDDGIERSFEDIGAAQEAYAREGYRVFRQGG